jgi:hypothetical protein
VPVWTSRDLPRRLPASNALSALETQRFVALNVGCAIVARCVSERRARCFVVLAR